MLHPLRVDEQAVGRLRVTIYRTGKVDYQVKRMATLEQVQFVKALRAVLAKIERQQVTRIYGPTGETLTTEATLGDMT